MFLSSALPALSPPLTHRDSQSRGGFNVECYRMLQQKGAARREGDESNDTYNTSLMSDSDFSLLLNLVTVVVGRLFEINFVIWVHPSLFPPSLLCSILFYVFVLEFGELAHCGHVPSISSGGRLSCSCSRCRPSLLVWPAPAPPPPSPSPAPI